MNSSKEHAAKSILTTVDTIEERTRDLPERVERLENEFGFVRK